MTETIKLKGRVKSTTLSRILNGINNPSQAITRRGDGSISYWTGKNLFIATPCGLMYWDISIVHGRN